MAERERVPAFPEFSLDEFEMRWRRAREVMRADDLDVLVLTMRENVEYFSGFRTVHWLVKSFAPGVVFFPAEGEPILLVAGFLRGTAAKTSWIEDIRWNPDAHSDPEAFPAMMVDIIKQMGAANGKIGIERGSEMILGLPLHHFQRFRSELPEASFEGVAELLWQLREIKSPAEIRLLEAVGELTCRAFAAARDAARPGMDEFELATIMKTQFVKGETDPSIFINIRAGTERYDMADVHPQRRKLQVGDMLVLDAGVLYHSYWSDIARVMHIGAPSERHKSVYQICVEAYYAAMSEVRAGAPVRDVYMASRRVLGKGDFGRWQDMVGHGIGLDLHEPPSLNSRSNRVLEEGMVLCVEPWINLPDLGVFALEDMVAVTSDGYDMLTPLPADELWHTQ